MNVTNLEDGYELGDTLFNHAAKYHIKWEEMLLNQKLQRMNKSCDGENSGTNMVDAPQRTSSRKDCFKNANVRFFYSATSDFPNLWQF